MDGGFVADGELVVAGGDGAVAFEPVYPALDSVALLVDPGVEGWWAAAGPALVLAVADLVGLFRDGAPDPTAPQAGAVGAGAVGLVCQYPPRAGPGPAPAGAGDADAAQDGLELGLSPRWPAVMTMARGFWPCSQARCTLVVNPPRERPRP